jgi:L-ascorbate 6-phosphate lactonase
MIQSDWGDWLPQAIESAEPDGLALWYLGCNGFALRSTGGETVYVDPYLGTGDPPRTIRMIPVPFNPDDVSQADAIFATHEHSDHVHEETQAPMLESTGANFYAPDASLEIVESEGWTDSWALDSDQLREVQKGKTVTLGDLTVHVEQANDPDADHPVAYVFEHPSGTFVHAGDARPGVFEQIGARYDVDLAAVAFGTTGMIPDKETREPERTTWYNDENMIIEVANELSARRLLPTHWDMWKGLTADPTVLHRHAASFEHPETLEVIEIGDRVDI